MATEQLPRRHTREIQDAAGPVFGPSRLAAGLLLAIMVFPTITAVSRDVLRAIPN